MSLDSSLHNMLPIIETRTQFVEKSTGINKTTPYGTYAEADEEQVKDKNGDSQKKSTQKEPIRESRNASEDQNRPEIFKLIRNPDFKDFFSWRFKATNSSLFLYVKPDKTAASLDCSLFQQRGERLQKSRLMRKTFTKRLRFSIQNLREPDLKERYNSLC